MFDDKRQIPVKAISNCDDGSRYLTSLNYVRILLGNDTTISDALIKVYCRNGNYDQVRPRTSSEAVLHQPRSTRISWKRRCRPLEAKQRFHRSLDDLTTIRRRQEYECTYRYRSCSYGIGRYSHRNSQRSVQTRTSSQ